jgi:hypothetical protein
MTLSPAEKRDLARYRMEKAKSLLRDAEILLESGSFSSSANRSFYAVLAAARSLLAMRGTDPESHEWIQTTAITSRSGPTRRRTLYGRPDSSLPKRIASCRQRWRPPEAERSPVP